MSVHFIAARALGALLLVALLQACGRSPSPDTSDEVFVDLDCAQPLPAEARDYQFTSPVAQDSDPLRDPLPSTQIYFTVMLPPRCADERFPVVLHTHGYGGSRQTALAADGTLYPQHNGLDAIDEMATALAYHNYVVVSWDQRGHGESQPRNGGGYARLNDPDFETRDARALLDWLYDHADELQLWTQPRSGIAKDLHVGTMGYSYGGGAQMPLAALDRRIDAIAPVATWYELQHSVAAEGALKQSWMQLLCLFAAVPSDGALIGTINTPAIDTLCNQAGARNPTSFTARTYDELVARAARATARPRPVDESEITALLGRGMHYFRSRQQAGQPWGYGESAARLRPVPALFLQGNRDGLFNLTEGYLNWRYFREAGGDARLVSMESGHLSPFAQQVDGTANCGGVQGVYALLAWYDRYLKGWPSAALDAIPRVCLSVQASPDAPAGPEIGVALDSMPVGSLSGRGALAVGAARIAVDVPAAQARAHFEVLTRIDEDGYVLAGVPTVGRVTVTAGSGATHAPIAIVGLGLRRGDRVYLIDDQVLGIGEGTRTHNAFLDAADPFMLPAVGEVLQAGDEIGLLFYEQHVEYSVLLSLSSLTQLLPGGLIRYLADTPLPTPLGDALTPIAGVLTNPNPYGIVLEDVALPVFKPGVYGASRWNAAGAE
ncbi:CocE/NonD family hydrolase [Solimonas flava]|uniref:CocE/NonD family hydrolase n=1 Tax=Solimonas flava TaxID=415849 RepID=UPI000409EE55|nr:CocE/NonD family hydrolase [Solimonas flava]